MAALEVNNSLAYIERRPLDPDITGYWERHKPSEFSPPLPEPSAAPAAAEAPGEYAPSGLPDYQVFFRTNRVKNVFIISGLSLFVVGAGMESLAWHLKLGDPAVNDMLMYTGYGFFGLGLFSLGAALFLNPSLPESHGPD
jgi:hypothetical protein